MNGSWVDVFVNINSHFQMLILPLHNVLDCGIFSECVHNKNSGPNVQDEDYLALVALLTSVEENDDNSVINVCNSIADNI